MAHPHLDTPRPGPDFLVEVDDDSWIIGGVMISRHTSRPSCESFWGDGEGGFFSVSKAPSPRPSTRPISDKCPLANIFHTETTQGTWKIGLAELRIAINVGTTPEHVTLEALEKKDFGFQTPKVYYHGVHDRNYHIIFEALPGKYLSDVWLDADEALRKRYAEQIAHAYHELSTWRGDSICGVDGNFVHEIFLCAEGCYDRNAFTPEKLRKNCEEIGMDSSNVVFAHNNMMPLSFIVNQDGLVGISRWESAGFVPKDWVRTKTRSNAFLEGARPCFKQLTREQMHDWEAKFESAIKDQGFQHHWEGNCYWREALHQK
ncbi:hypothetical protein ACHAPJ_004658 [Fusarium lateritium]